MLLGCERSLGSEQGWRSSPDCERPSHSDSRTMDRPDDNAMIARYVVLDPPVRGKVDVSQALVFRS